MSLKTALQSVDYFLGIFQSDKDIFSSKIWRQKKPKKLTPLLKGCYPIDEVLNVCSRIMNKKLHNTWESKTYDVNKDGIIKIK